MSKLTRLRPLLIGGNQVDLKRLEEVEELEVEYIILFILNQSNLEGKHIILFILNKLIYNQHNLSELGGKQT